MPPISNTTRKLIRELPHLPALPATASHEEEQVHCHLCNIAQTADRLSLLSSSFICSCFLSMPLIIRGQCSCQMALSPLPNSRFCLRAIVLGCMMLWWHFVSLAFILPFLVLWKGFRVESDTLASPQLRAPAPPSTEVDLEVERGTAASAASDAEDLGAQDFIHPLARGEMRAVDVQMEDNRLALSQHEVSCSSNSRALLARPTRSSYLALWRGKRQADGARRRPLCGLAGVPWKDWIKPRPLIASPRHCCG